jgi:hypothetical protein
VDDFSMNCKKLFWAIVNVFVISFTPFGIITQGIGVISLLQIPVFMVVVSLIENWLQVDWYYLLLALLFIGAIKIQMKFTYKDDMKKELLALADKREEGVILRNRLQFASEIEESQSIIDDLETWKKEVIAIIYKISPVEAKQWNILDRYSPEALVGTVRSENMRMIGIYSEHLTRLTGVIQRLNITIMG